MGAPKAIGYLRSDLSGIRQAWHETLIRSHAKQLGYNLCKTVVLSGRTHDRIALLLDTINRTQAEAVIIPAMDHLAGVIPPQLRQVAIVATLQEKEPCS